MDFVARVRNDVRHRLRRSMVGRALLQFGLEQPIKKLCVVSATRLSEKDFWRSSALGQSLMPWIHHPSLSVDVSFHNRHGLPQIYNARLRNTLSADALVFVHDDVWIVDPQWLEKVITALGIFDVVGVAGNTRISPNQPAWLFLREDPHTFVMDEKYLSGGIGHGNQSHGIHSPYGVTPARCELLDGVFLAVHAAHARSSGAFFDERFTFDFYDMDFCRRATQVNLRLGTWPIALTHQSVGEFGNANWRAALKIYFDKWRK